ncbi:phosphatidylglycerol lysyltransferase domain-containing protein [Metabacillus herbersteinensis]|uniref:Phosphatidylglycerol lysyltransferase domain-containing protein n=1 Tax=Metabacillus herbersteinensis TaxID=283816 RepID=A0ABV6GND5_9BACI
MDIIKKLEINSDWKFKKLCIDDMNIYTNYISKSSIPNEWSTTFPNLWASSSYQTILWTIVENMLVTFRFSKSKVKISLKCVPFGEGDPDHVVNILYKCMSFCYKWNDQSHSHTKVDILNEAQFIFLKNSPLFDKYFTFSYHRTKGINVLERHYSIEKLISLSGKDFAYVREAINSLYRRFPDITIRYYTTNDYDKLIHLYNHWLKTAKEKYFYISDKIEYRQILKYHTRLNQIILVAEIDGLIVGMIAGGELPNGQSWVSLRKTMNNGRGLTQALVVKLAEEIHNLNPNIELLNDGSDDGQEGIIFIKKNSDLY